MFCGPLRRLQNISPEALLSNLSVFWHCLEESLILQFEVGICPSSARFKCQRRFSLKLPLLFCTSVFLAIIIIKKLSSQVLLFLIIAFYNTFSSAK